MENEFCMFFIVITLGVITGFNYVITVVPIIKLFVSFSLHVKADFALKIMHLCLKF